MLQFTWMRDRPFSILQCSCIGIWFLALGTRNEFIPWTQTHTQHHQTCCSYFPCSRKAFYRVISIEWNEILARLINLLCFMILSRDLITENFRKNFPLANGTVACSISENFVKLRMKVHKTPSLPDNRFFFFFLCSDKTSQL